MGLGLVFTVIAMMGQIQVAPDRVGPSFNEDGAIACPAGYVFVIEGFHINGEGWRGGNLYCIRRGAAIEYMRKRVEHPEDLDKFICREDETCSW
jgi:hypothetical protein